MAAPMPTQRAAVDDEVMIKNFLARLDSKKSVEKSASESNFTKRTKTVTSNHANPLASVTNSSHPVPNRATGEAKPVPQSNPREIASSQPSFHVSATAVQEKLANLADGTSTYSDSAILKPEQCTIGVLETWDRPLNNAGSQFEHHQAQQQKETSQLQASASGFVPTIKKSKRPHENVFYSATPALPFTLRSSPLVDQYLVTDIRSPVVDTLHIEEPTGDYIKISRKEMARVRAESVDKRIAVMEAKHQAKAIASMSEFSVPESMSDVNTKPVPKTTIPGPVSSKSLGDIISQSFDKSAAEAQMNTLPKALTGSYECAKYELAASGRKENINVRKVTQKNLKLAVNSEAVSAVKLPSTSPMGSALNKASFGSRQTRETKMLDTAYSMAFEAGKGLNETLPVQPKEAGPTAKQEYIKPFETGKRMMRASSLTMKSTIPTVMREAEVRTKEDSEAATQPILSTIISEPVTSIKDPLLSGMHSAPSIINRVLGESKPTPILAITRPANTFKGRGFADENIDREHQIYFEAWGKPEARTLSPARVRRVVLRNLPTNHTAHTVASLVHGGPLEHIQHTPESSTASVLFLNPDDCLSYYNKTSNGIELPGDSLRVIWVELAKNVEPVSGMVRTYVERECSRCVRAIGVDDDMSNASVMRLAQGKGRAVEHITIKSTANGVQTAEVRFCDIKDAVALKAQLDRDEDWEACNVQYFPDPCGIAVGVHI